MPRPLPPLTWLSAFECTARHLSITRAAEELHVTPSAISQHLKALEERLGKRLFDRKTRGVALTESGRQLLPLVAGPLLDLGEAMDRFSPGRGGDVLEIACTISFASVWLTSRLHLFQQAFPNLRIRLSSTLWPEDYLTAMTDVQIRFGPFDAAGDVAFRLSPDFIVPVCVPALVSDSEHVDALWHLPLIGILGMEDSWQGWARQLGASRPPPARYLVDSYGLAIDLARAGQGIALVSRFLSHDLVAAGQLTLAIAKELPARECYFINVSGHARQPRHANAFRDWLIAEARSGLAS